MRFDAISEEMASGEVRQIFHDVRRELILTRVPRFFRVFGRNPSVLRGVWALYQSLILEGQVPRTTKELIALAIESGPDGSRYFREFHRHSLVATGVDAEIVDAIARDGVSPLLPDRTRRLIAFARRIAAGEAAADEETPASRKKAARKKDVKAEAEGSDAEPAPDPYPLTSAESAAFRREGLDAVAIAEIIALAGGVRALNACARAFELDPEVDPDAR